MFYVFRYHTRDAINSSARSTFFDRVPLGSAPSAYASVAPLFHGSLPGSAPSLGTTAWCLCGPLRVLRSVAPLLNEINHIALSVPSPACMWLPI
jgi:hypothetical protein